ncbi:MAG TPA: YaaC family protein, partial [Nitrospira sp.]|nr:YaaC family protein [Nitrospira sp.]
MDYRFWNRTTEGKWDWYPIRFLESNENLKTLLGKNSQKTISTGLASDISVCLQQGRAFFELSALFPLEIRPLQLFYGMVGFAKAVAVARKLERLDTLDRVHGLSDVSDPKGHIENFMLEFNSRGTFQAMNDSIKELEKLHIHRGEEIKKLTRATCGSDDLRGK